MKNNPTLLLLLTAICALSQQADYVFQVGNKPALDPREYVFVRTNGKGASGDLSAAGAGKLITFTPCPKATFATDGTHKVYISGGTGTAEAVPVTATTCTPSAASGTITVTTANTHTGAWAITSGTGGIQEALQTGGVGARVIVPAGIYTFRAQLVAPYAQQTLSGMGADLTKIVAGVGSNLDNLLLVSGVNDWTISGIKFDGNFVNQTSGAGNLVQLLNSTGHKIERCTFTHSGIGWPATSSAFGVLIDAASDITVEGNRFVSNWGRDLGFYTRDTTGMLYRGYRIQRNVFGGTLSESQSAVNWWDTYSAGMYSILGNGYSDMTITGNQIYGAVKKNALGNPIMIANSRDSIISGNIVEGMGNGSGTIDVLNSSGNITGHDTYFNTGSPSGSDVGAFLQIEGDTTVYRVSVVTSGTAITVTPVVTRASANGLRYKISSTGDGISCGGCLDAVMSSNIVRHSHDNGIDAGADAFFGTLNVGEHYAIVGNTLTFNNGVGLYIGGIRNSTITGNTLTNNGQAGAAVAASSRAGLFVDNSSATLRLENSYISGNDLSDNQSSATQQYGLSVTGSTGQGNILGPNQYSDNGTGPFYQVAGTTFSLVFQPDDLGSNTKAPPVSPMYVIGPNVDPSAQVGAFAVTGGDYANYLGFGYQSTANYGWIQAATSGVGVRPLWLNKQGGDVNTGAALVVGSGGSGGKAICWKADGKTLGYCSTTVDAVGACTCN